jgi:hypothetical protein
MFSTLLTTVALIKFGIAGYAIQDDYSASGFFDKFDFFTDGDPTHGFGTAEVQIRNLRVALTIVAVQYVDQATAQSSGMIKTTSNGVYMGVDSTAVAGQGGRKSVRVTSKKSYNDGLIILDLEHMPGSVCGTWPAFWTVGPSWPAK